MRRMLLILLAFLPSFIKIWLLRSIGHRIGKNVRIGISYIDVNNIILGDNVCIGFGNVFKGIEVLQIGEKSSIGKFNLFTANDYYRKHYSNDCGKIIIGEKSAITMRHYFDVQNKIEIGNESLIAGIGSIFFTHQKGTLQLNEAKSIRIGSHVYVGAACCIMPGAVVSDYIMVGGGSVISGTLSEHYSLYASPKANIVKRIDKAAAYFTHDFPAG